MMRLMRGAGLQGLDCMSSRDEREGIVLVRPMLRIGRKEIREALKKDGFTWREDETNRQDIYLRNDVRKRLIPLLEEISRGSTERIARTAGILTEENRLLCGMADRFLEEHSRPKQIDAEALKEIPEAFRIRVLRDWWQRNTPNREEHTLNYRQSKDLAALVTAERGKINLPDQMNAVRGRHTIHLTGFLKRQEEVPYSSCGISFGSCKLMTLPSMNHPGDGILTQEVPEEFAEGCVIRTRRAGDRIRPFGMNGSKKLQDYFTDRKIDEPWRDEIPLLCRGNEVFLAAGVGAGAVPLWNKDCINVRLEWQGDFPWLNSERKEMPHGQEC
jgi:tRNA(Ile)-lysidine synthase